MWWNRGFLPNQIRFLWCNQDETPKTTIISQGHASLACALLKNEEKQIFRLKDWKNGIIINRGKLGQGWINPSDTDEGQIFTAVRAFMCVCVRERASACSCNMFEWLLMKYFNLLKITSLTWALPVYLCVRLELTQCCWIICLYLRWLVNCYDLHLQLTPTWWHNMTKVDTSWEPEGTFY